ncbi:MAG: hypothetical protein WB975_02375 [Nitrososphaeraceae archaeon]
MLLATSAASLSVTPVQASCARTNPNGTINFKDCMYIPIHWFKHCPGCPERFSLLDIIKEIQNPGPVVNVEITRGNAFDTITMQIPKDLEMQNMSMMNASMTAK